jgi:hypothetical protein
MFGSAQNEQVLDGKDDPYSRWTMVTTTTPRAGAVPEARSEEDDPL